MVQTKDHSSSHQVTNSSVVTNSRATSLAKPTSVPPQDEPRVNDARTCESLTQINDEGGHDEPRPTETTASVETRLDTRKSEPEITADLKALIERRLDTVKARMLTQAHLPVGGRLTHFWRKWRELGAPKRVVRMIRKGYCLPFMKVDGEIPSIPMSITSPARLIAGYAEGSEKATALSEKIAELMTKKVIEEMPDDQPGHFNLVFLRPKKSGGWRLILDVSPLNEHLRCEHFSMDTWLVIRKAIRPGLWATSVDFSDAYHHIPINEAHVKYLCFQIGNKRYWYRAFPFGLSPGPKKFTDLCLPVKAWARNILMLIFQYLDDWLNLGTEPTSTAKSTLDFIDKCVELGLMVNLEKSEVIPTQQIVFLGCHFDFVRGMVLPPAQAWAEARELVMTSLASPSTTQSLLESTLGKLLSLEKMVPFGMINLRHLQQLVVSSTRQARDPTALICLSQAAKTNLTWWSRASNVMTGAAFQTPPPTMEIQTDASLWGWGISENSQLHTGTWSTSESRHHINLLEMKAVTRACNILTQKLQNRSVRFLIDNSTVVAHLNRQGGTRSKLLLEETSLVFQMCQTHNISITAHHIAGSLNVVADLGSRKGQVVTTEWKLCKAAFQWVQTRSPWGRAKVDMFANSLNHQLEHYVSPCPDQKAVAVDALTCKWPTEVLYAFPPSTIMEKVVARLLTLSSNVKLLLIAPLFQTAKWFPQLRALCRDSPLPLPLLPDLLQQPHWRYDHPCPDLLRLHLWQVEIAG